MKWMLLCIFSLFLCTCSNEYTTYHPKEFKQEEKLFSGAFTLSDIQKRDFEVYSTPNKSVLDKLIAKIDNAKGRIYVEVYILSEKSIIKSLVAAKKRGIDVRVILEKNVFGAGNINKSVFSQLGTAGISTVYANSSNYKFTHAKYIIIDNEYIISTGNFSHASFVNNTEIFLAGKNIHDLTSLISIFENDYKGEKYISCDYPLVVSPKCPRQQFDIGLKAAKKSIYIYAETIGDNDFEEIIKLKQKNNIEVKILLGDYEKIKSNKKIFDEFKALKIEIKAPKKPYIHAKMFLVDEEMIYIGSINFSTNSIENNREIGILFKNSEISKHLKNEFITIFSNSQ